MPRTRILAALIVLVFATVGRGQPPEVDAARGDKLIAEYVQSQTEKLSQSSVPTDSSAWNKLRDGWLAGLKDHCFAAWPAEQSPLDAKPAFDAEHQGVALRAIDFTSQGAIRLRLYIAHYPGLEEPDLVVLNPLNAEGWNDFLATMRSGFETYFEAQTLPPADDESFEQSQGMFRSFKWAMAYVAPTGVGPTAWDESQSAQVERQRQLAAVGQTVDSLRVWDVRRAIQTLRTAGGMKDVPLWVQAEGRLAGVALFAALFEPQLTRLDLYELPRSYRAGPYFLNVDRILDMPQAVAMAAEKTRIVIYQDDQQGWEYPQAVAKQLEWGQRLTLRKPPPEQQDD